MSRPTSSLIGSVVERKPSSSAPISPRLNGPRQTGFPTAQHRSKSAFARARSEQGNLEPSGRLQRAPVVSQSKPSPRPSSNNDSSTDWRGQMEAENARRIESMTEEEREQERQEILEKFGPGLGGVLQRARAAREAKGKSREEVVGPIEEKSSLRILPLSPRADAMPRKSSLASRPSSPVPPSASSTRPSSRADRHIRFADITPKDVFVYESAPPSPRRKPLALVAPSPDDGPTISLGEWKPMSSPQRIASTSDQSSTPLLDSPDNMQVDSAGGDARVEEGTPEDIRRRFFPSATPHDPSVAWMEEDLTSDSVPHDTSLRFDLTGTPIPSNLSSSLPTHLGLHHHAEGTHAGYTLDDIFLLSRSTVPAQRASMLDLLGKIARKLAQGLTDPTKGIEELKGQESELRKRILAAGVEAMGERGSLAARAVEAMWVCIVAWGELSSIEGVKLRDGPSDKDIRLSLPLDYVLPQIGSAFGTAALPPESLTQLLDIVYRLAQFSNDFCSKIVNTDGFVVSIIQYFLLKPIPPPEDSPLPDTFAIEVLTALASASRTNASSLVGPADALLRFVVVLPSSSPYPPALATSLLTATLRFYTVLASYGLYANIATTAYEPFRSLGAYIVSPIYKSASLEDSWLGLLEAWMVCARDPHQTTPSHDILWSQVVSWGWGEDILSFRQKLGADDREGWGRLWRALAAWLEGSSVNGVKGGEAEKSRVIQSIRSGFETGAEHSIVEGTFRDLKGLLQTAPSGQDFFQKEVFSTIASLAGTLAATIRLWLSCLPTHTQEPLDSPPFSLPFPQLSSFCASLASHPLWNAFSAKDTPVFAEVGLRHLSILLASYLDLTRALPGTTEDVWMAQAFTILSRLLPGDEEFALRTIESLSKSVVPSFMASRGWHVPPIIWERKGLEPVLPFLVYSLRSSEVRVGSLWMTPLSISSSTTQRFPPGVFTSSKGRKELALPLQSDWMFSPLDYLLRSGETDVFKSLPRSWDASETELVRGTLLFARVHREVLRMHGLTGFMLTMEETVFNCMKVFMLEHGQQEDSSDEEVFRDTVVGNFMDDLLAPFTLGAHPRSLPTSDLLDKVATRFLGTGTPFYQYYTDFVALYDSVSFSNPTFARLLLPPLSMRYPVDYRKYLWVDYGHVVRTIKIPVEAVVASDVEEFLWPLESNTDVITAYLRAVVKGQVEGFMRLVAIHHVASNIWSDLREGDELVEENSVKLLQAVVGQGDLDAIRGVVTYHQTLGVQAILPPACFDQDGDWRVARREFIARCGDDVKDRLQGLI